MMIYNHLLHGRLYCLPCLQPYRVQLQPYCVQLFFTIKKLQHANQWLHGAVAKLLLVKVWLQLHVMYCCMMNVTCTLCDAMFQCVRFAAHVALVPAHTPGSLHDVRQHKAPVDSRCYGSISIANSTFHQWNCNIGNCNEGNGNLQMTTSEIATLWMATQSGELQQYLNCNTPMLCFSGFATIWTLIALIMLWVAIFESWLQLWQHNDHWPLNCDH